MISPGAPPRARYTAGAFTHRVATMRRLLLPLLCLAAVTLAGCGNKGPLVLPSKPATAAAVAPTHAPAPASSSAAPAAAH